MKNGSRGNRLLVNFTSLILVFAFLFSVTSVFCFASEEAEVLAEAFISSVEGLEEKSGNEWGHAVEDAALYWADYVAEGGTPDANDRVAAAYAVYISEKNLYDGCITMIENSFIISGVGFANSSYDFKANVMDESYEIYTKYKNTKKFIAYEGISTAMTIFQEAHTEFERQRKYCKTYVESAALALSSNSFASITEYIEIAEDAKKRIEIEGYPGMENADKQIEDAKKKLSSAMNLAIPFIQAVQAIDDADNKFLAMISALAIYKTVDTTADGVAESYAELMNRVKAYNDMISAANSVADSVDASALGLIP